MRLRTLGTEGLDVSAIGLGCMGMSQSYGPADDRQSIATIHRALELGFTFFDTSDAYGWGHNERLVGEAVKEVRGGVVLATKFGIVKGHDGRLDVDAGPQNVAAACDRSLTRIGTDYIDLYYVHRVDPHVPIEETVGAMTALVVAGKVRYLGLSEASVDTIERAVAVHPIAALQSEWSLWSRDIEGDVLNRARQLGVGLVPYSPLGRGFFAGTIDTSHEFPPGDSRATHPRYQGDNFRRNLTALDALRDIARETGHTPGQLALAWLLARGDDVVPIPGTKRPGRVEENAGAVDVVLSSDVIDRIAAVIPPGGWAGARYRTDLPDAIRGHGQTPPAP